MNALKTIASFAIAAAALSASADVDSYLYWMVNDTVTYNETYVPGGGTVSYEYAKVKISGEDGYLSLYDTSGSLDTTLLDGGVTGAAGFSASPQFASFLVELYNADDAKVGWTTLSYSDAMSHYVYSDPTATGSAGVFTVTQVIPEPTSGLLLLVGGALLALRRRRGGVC